MVGQLISRMIRQHCSRCDAAMNVEFVDGAIVVYRCPICAHSVNVASMPDWIG